MNRFFFCILTAFLSVAAPVSADKMTPVLQSAIAATAADTDVAIIVKFTDQLDIDAFRAELELELKRLYSDPKQRKAERRKLKRTMMVAAMKKKSKRATQQMKAFLKSHNQNREFRQLWAVNSVALTLPVHLIEELSTAQWVKQLTLNVQVQGPANNTAPSSPHFWNLDATNAPMLWQRGYTGQGSVVAILDTGVDHSHPDLGPKWRGHPNDWFDPYNQEPSPVDWNGHGTRVMGLILGGDAGGYQIGMAPNAQWLAAKIFDNNNQGTFSGIHEAYQWVLDPDGDPNTDDAPDIVNNSWDIEGTVNQCYQEFTQDIQLLKEADIAVLLAGGNYGPYSATSVSPANYPSVISVGAINSQYTVSNSYSSQGPGACDGGIFPSMVAPGVSIFTADRMPQFYNFVSGTSFSVAHVAGGMALLKGAFPEATTSQLETAVTDNTVDLGSPGPENTYGYGMLDVEAAYSWLEANVGNGVGTGNFSFSAADFTIAENVTVLSISVSRTESNGDVSVDYASTDGAATAGYDYVSAAGTLNFADGETSRMLDLTILDDGNYEGDEDFTLTLSNPQGGATLGAISLATVTILDDEPQPDGDLQFSSAAYSVGENGNEISIEVVRSNGDTGTVTVDYATSDGSATAGSDYQPASGELTFADGQLSASFTVALLDDTVYEGDETVILTLSNPSTGANLGTPITTTLTLTENDPAGPADADNDGFNQDVDCDDNNAAIYPGAPEIKHDGIDQDCNGYDLTIDLTRIWYKQAKDQFIAWATSDLNDQANLSIAIGLSDGSSINRTLNWNANKNRWQRTINGFVDKFGSTPNTVTITGIEGTENGTVELR